MPHVQVLRNILLIHLAFFHVFPDGEGHGHTSSGNI